MGTVFYHLPDATSGYFSRGGILFLSVLQHFSVHEVSNQYIAHCFSVPCLLWQKYLPFMLSVP
jgi:hypothetical protein